MAFAEKMNFKMMSFIHETMYTLFRDPFKALNAAGLQSGQQVLEVGCGPGFFTLPASRIVGEEGSVTSIDVNPVAVEHVRKKVEESNATNVKTIIANAAHTDFPDQSFDCIFLFGVARAVGGVDKIWPEMHRLLKSTGVLAIEGRLKPPGNLFKQVKRQGRIVQYSRNGN
jgi:ubiquinone/menaquinone biosynthesis C-methylase UbiE